MPTTCPPSGACGTTAQVWLDPRNSPGTLLSPLSQLNNATVQACVSWNNGLLSDCCLFTVPVTVRRCSQLADGGFSVYYLGPTQGCDIAYCSAPPAVGKGGAEESGGMAKDANKGR